MVQIVTRNNLGNSFKLNPITKKINVNIDGETIALSTDGVMSLKSDSVAFIEAVRSAETKTLFDSRIDENGNRLLSFTNESGESKEINLTSFLADVQVSGGILNGQILTLKGGSSDITIDLGVFITESELVDALSASFNEVVTDAFGNQLFKVASL